MADELTRALLLEEAAPRGALAQALLLSVTNRVPLVQALIDSGALRPEVLVRYLARSEARFVRQVVPLQAIVDRLPTRLCERLLAVPIARDGATGIVEVAVVDPTDPHAARELAFHLGAPIRVVRATPSAVGEALRTLAARSAARTPRDRDEELFDSRPRSRPSEPPLSRRDRTHDTEVSPPGSTTEPGMNLEALRAPLPPRGVEAPPASAMAGADTDSDIPIPLTHRTGRVTFPGLAAPPPPVFAPSAMDATGAGDALPGSRTSPSPVAVSSPEAPRLAFADVGATLAALRVAGSRDEILELVLAGARTLAFKVGLFVAKRGGYVGWSCTTEFGDRDGVRSVVVPMDGTSVFDLAAREGLYLGPVRDDTVHASLLGAMQYPSIDVAVIPIRVSGKVVVVIVADQLGDAMVATRQLEALATAAGEALTRVIRARR